ncbi:hypothetical protein CLF_109159 [Clonorchis sinensis]|uniref:Uncharacterized protein n=1 Tax=Clonorchis sinensis TaxID=79923 RepID=G7YJ09_CLOSI|nr:hypothetical protein CLF_109159 [Clonorchis sinensis]
MASVCDHQSLVNSDIPTDENHNENVPPVRLTTDGLVVQTQKTSALFKLISSTYPVAVPGFDPGHLTCEASMLPLLHQRTLDASEFSRLNIRTCSHLSVSDMLNFVSLLYAVRITMNFGLANHKTSTNLLARIGNKLRNMTGPTVHFPTQPKTYSSREIRVNRRSNLAISQYQGLIRIVLREWEADSPNDRDKRVGETGWDEMTYE